MSLRKTCGIALVGGAFLLAFTMALHPRGGTLAHLQKIAVVNASAHTMGLIGVLFLYFGFITLRNIFCESFTASLAALITMIVGLSAGLLAAVINGIALPIFIDQLGDGPSYDLNLVKLIFKYGTSLNHAFDFVMEGAVILSTLLWSVVILKSKLISKYVAYTGLLFVILFSISVSMGIVRVDLHGFRIFILGFIVWILALAYSLLNSKTDNTRPRLI